MQENMRAMPQEADFATNVCMAHDSLAKEDSKGSKIHPVDTGFKDLTDVTIQHISAHAGSLIMCQ